MKRQPLVLYVINIKSLFIKNELFIFMQCLIIKNL